MTNERHGNSILNNEQHLFTLGLIAKRLRKELDLRSELWNLVAIRHFVVSNRQFLPQFAV